MTDFDAILSAAVLPEDTVPVCTRGDLLAKYKQLGREIVEARARNAADPRLAGGGTGELGDQAKQLHEQIQAATVPFRLRALPREEWRELTEQHPPRLVDGKVHPDDQAGVNNDTFFPALIRKSTVEPQLRDETWQTLLDDGGPLSDAQYLALAKACWNLNRRDVNVPFSYAALLPTAASSPDSGPLEPSASL